MTLNDEQEKIDDMARWQRYQNTGRAIPHEAVEQWLASWGTENELPSPKR